MPPRTRPPLTRFAGLFRVNPVTECWDWAGYVGKGGYGTFRMPSGTTWAHRAAWELYRGPIGVGLHIDHLCRNPGCVNPAHLEPVTPQVNTDRGMNHRRTHCAKAGHPMTPDNTGNRSSGKRYCQDCHVNRERARRARLAGLSEHRVVEEDPSVRRARTERWERFCAGTGLDPATGQELSNA